MSDFSKSLSVTASGLRAQAARLTHVSENISNADTPGYRRKTVSFQAVRDLETDVSQVKSWPGVAGTAPNWSKFTIPPTLWPMKPVTTKGSNVDLMIEIADAREAQRTYEANLKMFDQTRQMSSSLMDLVAPLT